MLLMFLPRGTASLPGGWRCAKKEGAANTGRRSRKMAAQDTQTAQDQHTRSGVWPKHCACGYKGLAAQVGGSWEAALADAQVVSWPRSATVINSFSDLQMQESVI